MGNNLTAVVQWWQILIDSSTPVVYSPYLSAFNWHQLLLYPAGTNCHQSARLWDETSNTMTDKPRQSWPHPLNMWTLSYQKYQSLISQSTDSQTAHSVNTVSPEISATDITEKRELTGSLSEHCLTGNISHWYHREKRANRLTEWTLSHQKYQPLISQRKESQPAHWVNTVSPKISTTYITENREPTGSLSEHCLTGNISHLYHRAQPAKRLTVWTLSHRKYQPLISQRKESQSAHWVNTVSPEISATDITEKRKPTGSPSEHCLTGKISHWYQREKRANRLTGWTLSYQKYQPLISQRTESQPAHWVNTVSPEISATYITEYSQPNGSLCEHRLTGNISHWYHREKRANRLTEWTVSPEISATDITEKREPTGSLSEHCLTGNISHWYHREKKANRLTEWTLSHRKNQPLISQRTETTGSLSEHCLNENISHWYHRAKTANRPTVWTPSHRKYQPLISQS